MRGGQVSSRTDDGEGAAGRARILDAAQRLLETGARVSLFVDPDQETLRASADLGVPAVELHTG
jgi:pyridoxine 5-phosphate synthase